MPSDASVDVIEARNAPSKADPLTPIDVAPVCLLLLVPRGAQRVKLTSQLGEPFTDECPAAPQTARHSTSAEDLSAGHQVRVRFYAEQESNASIRYGAFPFPLVAACCCAQPPQGPFGLACAQGAGRAPG